MKEQPDIRFGNNWVMLAISTKCLPMGQLSKFNAKFWVSITCRLREIMQIRYMQISHMAFNVGKQCHVVMLCDDMLS